MGTSKLRSKDLVRIGYEKGSMAGLALQLINQKMQYADKTVKLEVMQDLLNHPHNYKDDPILGSLAERLIPPPDPREGRKRYALNPMHAPFKIYGGKEISDGAKEQMRLAMRLPVAEAGALMPDAHQGYGLPVGGVLATRNVVIPYAVGVDIGCRMALSIFDRDPKLLDRRDSMKRILLNISRFGQGIFSDPFDDPILERPEFKDIAVVRDLKDKAWQQIGTSGSGNHFVEFGEVVLSDADNPFGLEPGRYLGLLSHSGSRGFGAGIANHYQEVARNKVGLPKEVKRLAWLDLNEEAGQEYWAAMTLAGDYAVACHKHIHRRAAYALQAEVLALVENHHNYAWKTPAPDGGEWIVHRKGATPAENGKLGIIPGSMVSPGFIVRGKGVPDALNSASHGAGRKMSRKAAANSYTYNALWKLLDKENVTLVGGRLDEAPVAFKDINKVMLRQQDLVEVVGTFLPRIVRMDK